MTKKFTVFGVAILLFVIYLSYEYLYILRTYTGSSSTGSGSSSLLGNNNPENSNNGDLFRFSFTPPIVTGPTDEKHRDLMGEQYLNQFKMDLMETLSHIVKEDEAIMPFMPNNSARAELGQATWRLLHTMAVRFFCLG